MIIMELLMVVIASVGVTNIITSGGIFEGLREAVISESDFFGKLILCPMCLGFWVGLIISLFFPINLLVGAAASSLFSQIYDSIVDLIDVSASLIASKVSSNGEINES